MLVGRSSTFLDRCTKAIQDHLLTLVEEVQNKSTYDVSRILAVLLEEISKDD